MISEQKIDQVMERFFNCIKSGNDYEIENTGMTYYQLLDIIKQASKDAIKKNPEKFTKLIEWIINAAMYMLNDIDELDEIDLQLRNTI